MADPAAGGGDGQNIQAQIEKETEETVDSTRRMLTLMAEAQDAGINTLVNLDDQGEQLDRIEAGLDQVNKDMKEAEENLAGMEKCCGLCMCPWQKSATEENEEYKKAFKSKEDGAVVGGQPQRVADERNGVQMSGNYCTRITDDKREDEMEDNLGQLAQGLTNLKHMALDMGNEVSSQNRQLERVSNKAKVMDDRLHAANTRADNLLK